MCEKYIVDNENNVNNDLSFISSKSAEFQEVFLNKRESKQQPLEEKFSRLEKNVNILFENFVYSQENSKINQEKNEEILTLINVLKIIKKECEIIQQNEEEKNLSFMQEYAKKLLILENEMKKYEEHSNKKKKFVQETFQIFDYQGKKNSYQMSNEKIKPEISVKNLNKQNFPKKTVHEKNENIENEIFKNTKKGKHNSNKKNKTSNIKTQNLKKLY